MTKIPGFIKSSFFPNPEHCLFIYSLSLVNLILVNIFSVNRYILKLFVSNQISRKSKSGHQVVAKIPTVVGLTHDSYP